MKIRFLLLMMIAGLAVGCSAFFEPLDSVSRDEYAPESEIIEVEEEATERRSSSEDRVDEPLPSPPIDMDEAEGYYDSDIVELPDVGGGGAGGDGGSSYGGGAPAGDDSIYGADFDGEYAVESDFATTSAYAPEVQQISPLKAGEIDDNAEWDDYLLYRQESLDNFGDWVNDVDVTGRRIITVTDSEGLPVLGATVSVTIGDTLVSQTRTYADGRTLYLSNANPDPQANGDMIISVEKDGITASLNMSLVRMAGPHVDFVLDMEQNRASVQLDVVFLLDATGSMSDEIGQLQENILSISRQIDEMGDVDVRYGLVHYRDREDAYITQVHDFTPDVTQFQADLNSVRADGGGDNPESLNAGLHDALHSVEWRGANTIKLVFLVADAPPHLDYPDDYNYAEEMLYASDRGIKIHPIASSGLDAVGEYIFRQIGQTTMGRFIFLTYSGGVAGEAGDERPDLAASEQDYTVDFLDGLVVQLVEDEINAFKGLQ